MFSRSAVMLSLQHKSVAILTQAAWIARYTTPVAGAAKWRNQ